MYIKLVVTSCEVLWADVCPHLRLTGSVRHRSGPSLVRVAVHLRLLPEERDASAADRQPKL